MGVSFFCGAPLLLFVSAPSTLAAGRMQRVGAGQFTSRPPLPPPPPPFVSAPFVSAAARLRARGLPAPEGRGARGGFVHGRQEGSGRERGPWGRRQNWRGGGTSSPGLPYRDWQSLQRSLMGPPASSSLVAVHIDSAIVVRIGFHVGGDSSGGRLHNGRLRAVDGSLHVRGCSGGLRLDSPPLDIIVVVVVSGGGLCLCIHVGGGGGSGIGSLHLHMRGSGGCRLPLPPRANPVLCRDGRGGGGDST